MVGPRRVLTILCSVAPSEIVFQEQSYSSLHSGQSLAWDHFRGGIDNFCGVIADPCSIVMILRGRRCLSLRDWLNIVKHHETLVKHCDTSWNAIKHHETLKTFDVTISVLDVEKSMLCAVFIAHVEFLAILVWSFQRYRRLRSWYNSTDV